MRHEPTALTFPNRAIISAIILLAAASALALASVRSVAQTLSASRAHSSLSQPQKKRIVALRRSDPPAGSRLSFISDSSLDDYNVYVEETRFFIRLPQAALINSQTNPTGRGFADMRVEQRDDDVVLSFILQRGATVSFSQTFNRLDVVFMTNEQTTRNRLIE